MGPALARSKNPLPLLVFAVCDAVLSFGSSMESILLLMVAAVTDRPSGFAHSTAGHRHRRTRQLQASLLLLLIILIPPKATAAGSVGIRGGFGERQPGSEYDTGDPLFNLDMLITGVCSQVCVCTRILVVLVDCCCAACRP